MRDSNAGALSYKLVRPRGGAQPKFRDGGMRGEGESRFERRSAPARVGVAQNHSSDLCVTESLPLRTTGFILLNAIYKFEGTDPNFPKEYAVYIGRLKAARPEAGLTQMEVPKKLRRPQSHISNIETGQQRLDVVELKRFARMYNKDITYFTK